VESAVVYYRGAYSFRYSKMDQTLFFCMYFIVFQVSKGQEQEGFVYFAPLNFNGSEENDFSITERCTGSIGDNQGPW